MGCSPSRGYVRDGSGSERERARRIFRRPKVSIRVGPAVKPLQGDEPRIVFIFGGPGSRKGIIIDRLIQMYGFILLSAEDLILHQLPKRVSHAIDVRNTQGMSSLLREDPSHLTLDWVLKLMGDRIFADSEKHFLIDMVPNLKFLLKVKSFMKDCTAEMEEFEEHHPCAFALNLAIPEDRVLKQVEEALCKKKQAENMPEVDQQQTDEMDTSRTRRRHELYQSSVKAFLDYFHQTERVVTVDVSCGIPDLIWGRVQSFFGELDFKPRRPVKTVVLFVLEEEDLKGIELAKYGIVKVNLNTLSGDDGCYGSDKLLKALHDYMQALSHDTENFAVTLAGSCIIESRKNSLHNKGIVFCDLTDGVHLEDYMRPVNPRRKKSLIRRKSIALRPLKAVISTTSLSCLFQRDIDTELCRQIAVCLAGHYEL
ncbi:uncharacterized protein LOC144920509 [Branchiostoma floridae x Branchiostoma belcheri]